MVPLPFLGVNGGKAMRKLLIVGCLVVLGAVSANAQENRGVEVAGTYQYVRFNPGNGASGINCQGGSGSFGAYLTSSIGVVGEFGACKVTGLGSAASNAFALTAGGGADITLTKHVSFRAQGDYLYTHFGGANQNSLRVQSGLVWRFGR